MSDTWKFGQTNTKPLRAALNPSEINRLRKFSDTGARNWRAVLLAFLERRRKNFPLNQMTVRGRTRTRRRR